MTIGGLIFFFVYEIPNLIIKCAPVGPKSRIIKRVLLKNVKHDAGFPTFQKKIIYI